MTRYNSALALLLTSLCPVRAKDLFTSPVYLDNDEYFMKMSNVISIPFSDLQKNYKNPNLTDEATFSGYDWTKPFPGSAISGFEAHARVTYDVPVPDDLVENATTALTALTYSIPESMMQSNGTLPKAMDPSWYICRHIFVGTKPRPSDPFDHACDFLGSECVSDVKSSLTKDWMNVTPEIPCSGLGFDPIPRSCRNKFGFARQDVIRFDADFMSDDEIAKVEAVDVQHPWNWRMGTGYHDPGDTSAYEAAADRTYLLVDVWGYSPSAAKDSRQTPDATLTCLRPKPVKQNSGTAVGATNTTLSSTTPTTNSGMLGKRSRPIMGLLSLVSFALVGV